MPPPDRIWSATQQREIEALMRELSSVARVRRQGHAVLYEIKQLGLFEDRTLPPELEVMRVLRALAEAHRLTILREDKGGLIVHVKLRSGLEVEVAYAVAVLGLPRRSTRS